MLKFSKNRKQTFECKVEIEGADYSKTRSRLVLSPSGDVKHVFFEGKIDGGVCSVIIPEGLEIAAKGDVVLEVVVDNTLFTPWTSTYEMLTENVRVNEIVVKKNEGNVRVAEMTVQQPTPTVKVTPIEKPHGLIRETTTPQDRKRIEEYVASFKKLNAKDRKFLKETLLPKFKPSAESKQWALTVFTNVEGIVPRVCMYAFESKKKKR